MMISVTEARQYILQSMIPSKIKTLALLNALDCHLAEDVYALVDVPLCDQSAMDGYALAFQEHLETLDVVNEIMTGSEQKVAIKANQAVRIFTGGVLPQGADTVVMQEHTQCDDNRLKVLTSSLKKGKNVRCRASEIAQGTLAMRRGDRLTVAALGFLASIGISSVKVYVKPTICIINTGNELQTLGRPLQYGQVYDANAYLLKAALQKEGIYDVRAVKVSDDITLLQAALLEALETSDIILLTGGVSVGKYDFVRQAFALCQVKEVFYKVKQKPGKPLLFGRKDNVLVFGLPGNPASVLTCYYEYVFMALRAYMQSTHHLLASLRVALNADYEKNLGLTYFLKGYYDKGCVKVLTAQESFRLSTYALANCLVVMPEHKLLYKKGEIVDIHLLP